MAAPGYDRDFDVLVHSGPRSSFQLVAASGWRSVSVDRARSLVTLTRGTELVGQTVAIRDGGLATSSVTLRRWNAGGTEVHHIVDPTTGAPAPETWRTVSVAAATCVDANVAATASILLGDAAPAWLDSLGLHARLVRRDGSIARTGAWPD